MIIMSIIGTRPQYSKCGMIDIELKKYKIEHIIVDTGQHYDKNMSDVFIKQFDLQLYDIVDLNVFDTSIVRFMASLEDPLKDINPDLVLVYGDTDSTLAGAMVAHKMGYKVCHIEAGYRSYNRNMPEEINRFIVDYISDIKFTHSLAFKECIIGKWHCVGDLMSDIVKEYKNYLKKPEYKNYYLLTLHRGYNVDNQDKLLSVLKKIDHLDRIVVFPIHPRTLKNLPNEKCYENINFIEPQGYIEFLSLLKYCDKVITDSGGVQREAYLLKKPCITIRSETEHTETVAVGWNLLLDYQNDNFVTKIKKFKPPEEHPNIYGNDVAKEIVKILLEEV